LPIAFKLWACAKQAVQLLIIHLRRLEGLLTKAYVNPASPQQELVKA